MLGRDQILIGLSPTCLRVATLKGGRIGKVNCTPLEPGEWERSWSEGLAPFDGRLSAALKDMGVSKGAAARVVYYSPRATAEVFSPPVRGAAALQAAQFALIEALPSSEEPWPLSLNHLITDSASAVNPKSHVLGFADSPSNTEAVSAWLARAGLRVGDLLPAKGAALAQAVRVASDLPTEGTHALLWVDDHVTVLAGWSEGRLIFARSLDFGFWMLAEAMMRGARSGEQRGIPQQLAYTTLFAVGVPQRQQTGERLAGVSVEGALPLMQPVLQRYLIETRQTLRFSVPESEQSRIKVMVAGPGATIPNLSQSLEGHFDSGIEVHLEEAGNGVSALDAGELSTDAALARLPGLLPPSEADVRMHGRLNSSLRVGGAVVAMLLLAAGGWTFTRTAALGRELKGMEARVQEMSEHDLLVAKAEKLSGDITSASQMIKDTIGERPRWFAGLALVSRECGELIELNHIAGSYPPEENKAPVLTISGTAYPPSGKTDSLAEFVARLSKNPVIANVKIVSTHATEVSGVEAKSFIVSVQLRSIDADAGLAGVLDAPTAAEAMVREEVQP